MYRLDIDQLVRYVGCHSVHCITSLLVLYPLVGLKSHVRYANEYYITMGSGLLSRHVVSMLTMIDLICIARRYIHGSQLHQ
jgi:hypothetical protein